MWDDGLLDALVSAGLANARPHAQHRLDLLFAAGCIDFSQSNQSIMDTVADYQRMKGQGWARDDILAGLKAAGGAINVPLLADVPEEAY